MVDIDRINQLARKSRESTLTEEEKQEQAKLRKEYVDAVKRNFEAQLNNIELVDENGKPLKPKS